MILIIDNHHFHYESENVCRIFFPNEDIVKIYDKGKTEFDDDKIVYTLLAKQGDFTNIFVKMCIDSKKCEASVSLKGADDDKKELTLAQMLYRCFSKITGYSSPWGIVTGVRPSKLMLHLKDEMGAEKASDYFKTQLLASEKKTLLTMTVAENEAEIYNTSRDNSFSLYISIPFCPSRCSYCSFVSHSIEGDKAKKLVPLYIEKLCREIKATADKVKSKKSELQSVYIGGGTPGVLSENELDVLLSAVENSFDLSKIKEYTVEIGRPDTVTEEKLLTLKKHNVSRISINPQTFNQKTLDVIGRRHSTEQIFSAFALAEKYDFESINMDLIAGLPGENYEDYVKSVDSAVELNPDNITVHTLALKRSSNLGMQGAELEGNKLVEKMLDYSQNKLYENGYIPYYMYRQSKCLGNLENVGWCKKGKNGYYNVIMMEELHTVLACGAGAVTKIVDNSTGKIERIFNYKYPFEYVDDFEEILKRKEGIK